MENIGASLIASANLAGHNPGMFKLKWTRRTMMFVLGAVILTLVGVIVAVNLTGSEKKIEQRIERLYALDDPRFLHELGVLLGPQFIPGNHHKVLQSGDEIFPAMLAAIRGARASITFETYIYWAGDIGKEFADALSERARNGVKVHVLLDWVGSATAIFEADMSRSRQITFTEWRERPWREKIGERLASLIGSQL